MLKLSAASPSGLTALTSIQQSQISGGHIGDGNGPQWYGQDNSAFQEQVEREAKMLQGWWDSFVSLF